VHWLTTRGIPKGVIKRCMPLPAKKLPTLDIATDAEYAANLVNANILL